MLFQLFSLYGPYSADIKSGETGVIQNSTILPSSFHKILPLNLSQPKVNPSHFHPARRGGGMEREPGCPMNLGLFFVCSQTRAMISLNINSQFFGDGLLS